MKRLGLLAIFLLWACPAFAADPSQCVVPAGFPGIPVVSSAAESSHVFKASPGCLLGFYATPGSTAGYMMIFNATSAPSDGAVTPVECVQVPANTTISASWIPQPPEWFSVGITAVFSTTGCFTKTGANSFLHGLVQ